MIARSCPRASRFALAALALAAAAPAACADAGTPLIWGGCFHLTLGNLLLGMLEGLLLTRVFRLPRPRTTVALMIAANYISAWSGFGLTLLGQSGGFTRLTRHITIYNEFTFEIVGLLALFALTVLLEWPLCTTAMPSGPARWLRGLRASLIAQAASYALLVPYYAFCSYSFLTPWSDVHLASAADIALNPPGAWVYYLDLDDGDVYRIRPAGTERAHVAAANIKSSVARVCVAAGPKAATFDLCVQPEWYHHLYTRVLPAFASRASVPKDQWEAVSEEGCTGFAPKAAELRPPEQRGAEIRAGSWPAVGLVIDDFRLHLGFETPLIHTWQSRIATVLPGDQVVYQLGDQIVLLDLKTMRLGLITLGRGPLVILDVPPSTAPAATGGN